MINLLSPRAFSIKPPPLFTYKTSKAKKTIAGMMAGFLALTGIMSSLQFASASGVPAWTANGVVIAPNDAPAPDYRTGTQSDARVVADGSGGVWSVFLDSTETPGSLRLQHLDSSGARLLGNVGVQVAVSAGEQSLHEIVSDGGAGVYVVWEDRRTAGDKFIYAQHFNASGAPQWTADGVAVNSESGNDDLVTGGSFGEARMASSVLSDASGNLYIAWFNETDFNFAIKAQKLNSSGLEQWTSGGVSVSDQSVFLMDIALDGAGGLYLDWQASEDLRAQHVNASGTPTGTSGGVIVATTGQSQSIEPMIVTTGTDAIVVWNTRTEVCCGIGTIKAQRINTSIAPQWGSGVNVSASAGTVDDGNGSGKAEALADGAGGAFFAWMDFADFSVTNVRTQRINGSGAVQWGSGTVITDASTNSTSQDNPVLALDGSGGTVVAWNDSFGSNVLAQDLNGSGATQWTAFGVQLTTTAYGAGNSFELAADGSGNTYLGFQGLSSQASNDRDAYVQKVNSGGSPQWNGTDAARLEAFGGSVSAEESDAKLAADGAGHYFTVWNDRRGPNQALWGQEVDSSGAPMWDAAGLELASVTGDNLSIIRIISDSAGGFYAGWNDDTLGQGRINRFDSDGGVHAGWPAGGVSVSTDEGILISDFVVGPDGVFVVFSDINTTITKATHITAAGVVDASWGATGVAAADPGIPFDSNHAIDNDGSGGVYIGWSIDDGSLFLTHLQSDGSTAPGWTLHGNLVSDAANIQKPVIKAVTGGVVVAWTQLLTSPQFNYQVKAQKFSSTDGATPLWTPSGVGPGLDVETSADTQKDPHMIAAGADVIIVYKDSHFFDSSLSAQRLNGATGGKMWGNDGTSVTNTTRVNDSQETTYIDTDGAQGVVITWTDYRNEINFFNPDVFAQHINSTGVTQWGLGGVAIAERQNKVDRPTDIISNGGGGAVVAFTAEGSPSQVRLQNVLDSGPGTLGIQYLSPNGGETFFGGDTAPITWVPAGDIDHFRISLSTDSGASYPTVITSSTSASPFSWSVPFIDTVTARIRVEALDGGGGVLATDQSDNDFTISSSKEVNAYRWRNDNGSETGATYAAPENTPLTGLAKDTTKRLRFGLTGPFDGPDTNTAAIPMFFSGDVGPHRIAQTPDGTHLYVTNYASNDVSVIDRANEFAATASVDGNTDFLHPTGIAIGNTSNGVYAYVASEQLGVVAVIDTSDDSLVTTIPVGNFPEGVAISPDFSHVYVANRNDDTVSIIATGNNTVIGTVSLGAGSHPEDVVVSPDNAHVYVSTPATHDITVITSGSTGTIDVGGSPSFLSITPDGTYIYVTNNFTDDQLVDHHEVDVVQVLANGSGAANQVSDRLTGFTDNVNFPAVAPDGKRVYVSRDSHFVDVIDTVTNAVINSIPLSFGTDGETPSAIAVSPDSSKIYVAAIASFTSRREVYVITQGGAKLRLEYAQKTGGSCLFLSPWIQVGSAGGTEDWTMSNSSNLTDGQPTTDSAGLSDGAETFFPGQARDVISQTKPLAFDDTHFSEVEYSIKANPTDVDGTPYCFRLTDAGDETGFSFAHFAEATLAGGGPSVTVDAPNGGEDFAQGGHTNISFESSGSVDHFRISLSTDSGSTFPTVLSSFASNPFDWTIPNILTSTARIRVEALDGSNGLLASDDSDSDFSISVSGSGQTVTLLGPNGGENLAEDNFANVTYDPTGTIDHFQILLSTDSGASFPTVVTASTLSPPYLWTVNHVAPTTTARLRIQALDASNGVLAFDDSDGDFSITVGGGGGGPTVSVTAPNGGQSFTGGGSTNVSFSHGGTIDHYKILLSTDSGSTFPTVVTASTADSPFAWTIPDITTTTARIRVQALDGSNGVLASDDSNSDFSITGSGGGGGPAVTVTAPNGGENFAQAAHTDVTFTHSGTVDHYRVSLSTDSGSTFPTEVTASTAGSPFDWTLPAITTSTARIKVEAMNGADAVLASDISDGDFSISVSGGAPGSGPTATVTASNGGEHLAQGSSSNITFTSGGTIDHFKILLSTDSGSTFPTVITNSTAGSPFNWTVDDLTTTTARIRVQALDGANGVLASDDSDADFSITAGGGGGTDTATTDNVGTMSRLKVDTDAAFDLTFTLPTAETGTLTVTWPGAFTVLSAFTGGSCSGGGTIDTFAFSDGSKTMTAEKHACAGTVTLTGASVHNPIAAGNYTVSWVNDSPGSISIPVVDSDQVTVTATVSPSLVFDIDLQASANALPNATESAAPYVVDLGTISTADTRVSGTTDGVPYIMLDLSANASGGAVVTVKNQNGANGLVSTSVPADTINSASGAVNDGIENYGLCSVGATQTAGGPITATAGSFSSGCTGNTEGNTVLGFNGSPQTIYSSPGSVAFGRMMMAVQASISNATAAHNDYTDLLTFIATASF